MFGRASILSTGPLTPNSQTTPLTWQSLWGSLWSWEMRCSREKRLHWRVWVSLFQNMMNYRTIGFYFFFYCKELRWGKVKIVIDQSCARMRVLSFLNLTTSVHVSLFHCVLSLCCGENCLPLLFSTMQYSICILWWTEVPFLSRTSYKVFNFRCRTRCYPG